MNGEHGIYRNVLCSLFLPLHHSLSLATDFYSSFCLNNGPLSSVFFKSTIYCRYRKMYVIKGLVSRFAILRQNLSKVQPKIICEIRALFGRSWVGMGQPTKRGCTMKSEHNGEIVLLTKKSEKPTNEKVRSLSNVNRCGKHVITLR